MSLVNDEELELDLRKVSNEAVSYDHVSVCFAAVGGSANLKFEGGRGRVTWDLDGSLIVGPLTFLGLVHIYPLWTKV